MPKLIISIVICCFNLSVYSQGFINANKPETKKYLSLYNDKEKVQTLTTESDTSITFLVRDSTVQNLDLLLQFNESGKCSRELRVFSCDSCYRKILNTTLAEKYWGWTEINSKTYFSKFKKHLILNVQVAGSLSYEIRSLELSKKEFKRRLKKQVEE